AAIWLEMAQILRLAASISPPMLPVVSRQNTTSTSGRSAFLGVSPARPTPPAKAATAATRRAPRNRLEALDMISLLGTGTCWEPLPTLLDETARPGDGVPRPAPAAPPAPRPVMRSVY